MKTTRTHQKEYAFSQARLLRESAFLLLRATQRTVEDAHVSILKGKFRLTTEEKKVARNLEVIGVALQEVEQFFRDVR